MELEKEPSELNNSFVHGRSSNKAKHRLMKTDYADKVAGVSDSAIEESSKVVNGNDINGLENKSRKQDTLRKRKKCYFPNGESITYDNSVEHTEERVGGLCTNSMSRRSVNVDLTSGVVEGEINCIDVDTSSLNASSPGKSSKKKGQGKRKKSKKSHFESAESSVNGVIDKAQLPESVNEGNEISGNGNLHNMDLTPMSVIEDSVVGCVDADIDSLHVDSLLIAKRMRRKQARQRKSEKRRNCRLESVNEGNEVSENGKLHNMDVTLKSRSTVSGIEGGAVGHLSDLQVNENSGVQLPSGEVGKMIEPVDVSLSCIRSSKRKRIRKDYHMKDQGSGCDISLSNLGGPLVSSSSMNILGETVVDLSSNSRVSKSNNVEPKSAEVEKGSDEPDVDHDSVNAINQGNLERKKKKNFSDLQINENSGVQLPFGEVGKMIEPVDVALSCIRSSKKKRKRLGVHIKAQGSGCDTSLSNLGGPLVSSSPMNILGETVVDLSSNSRVSKSNNVEPESAVVEKGSYEPDVDHDSVSAINQGNLERKKKKKLSDLHVNENSGVQLPSGEVGKMIEPVDLTVSCLRRSKRNRKDNVVHKKETSQTYENVYINQRNLDWKEMKKRAKLIKMLQPGMHVLHPRNYWKKLLILDVNGILVDIVSVGRTIRSLRSHRVLPKKAVHSRPFYMDFLNFCFERFNVVIWSSRTRKNLNLVLNYLLGPLRSRFLFVWNQSHCTNTGFYTIENEKKPLFLKELKSLLGDNAVGLPWKKGVYNESNTLLIDDSPYKALRNPPHTAIFPHSYQFSDTNDVSLGPGGDLRVYLERLACADHVQNFVKQNPFGQAPITENNESWEFYLKIIGNNTPSQTPAIIEPNC